MLKPTSPVPPLVVDTLGGGTFDIQRATPQTFTLVAFYRGVHCPKCKLSLGKLDSLTEEFRDLGVEPVAISTDAADRAERARAEWSLERLPVGYGLTIETARSWGLAISNSISEKETPQFAEPSVFLVRPDATLYAAAVQTMPFARPDFAELLQAVNFIKEKNYPPRGDA